LGELTWASRSGEDSIFLSERESRSGESISPQREREECSVVGLTRSSGERFDFWAKCELAQASVTRLSESLRLVLCVVLA